MGPSRPRLLLRPSPKPCGGLREGAVHRRILGSKGKGSRQWSWFCDGFEDVVGALSGIAGSCVGSSARSHQPGALSTT